MSKSTQKLVVNEWLIHDLSGENGQESQELAWRFLTTLQKKCDRIIVLRNSPWAKKAHRLMKSRDTTTRTLSKLLHRSILFDPDKCIMLNANELRPAPTSLPPEIKQDDVYLIRTYLSSHADLLLTTDKKLVDTLHSCPTITALTKQQFLPKYLSSPPNHHPKTTQKPPLFSL